ncbi:hypothetical protein SAMN05414139_00017 [Burkholderia sp. D7]|nr:hypothetical protein SAMN05414139_00017 [Burkholderia sp. D7]
MSTFDYEKYFQNLVTDILIPGCKEAFDHGVRQGFEQGFATGRQLGFVEGVNYCKPAMADGLRAGSSECGRTMQTLKNLGVFLPEGEGKKDGED